MIWHIIVRGYWMILSRVSEKLVYITSTFPSDQGWLAIYLSHLTCWLSENRFSWDRVPVVKKVYGQQVAAKTIIYPILHNFWGYWRKYVSEDTGYRSCQLRIPRFWRCSLRVTESDSFKLELLFSHIRIIPILERSWKTDLQYDCHFIVCSAKLTSGRLNCCTWCKQYTLRREIQLDICNVRQSRKAPWVFIKIGKLLNAHLMG